MYIRLKKIKKSSGNVYEYAYLVGSKWKKRKKQAKQLHSKFLGRSYEYEDIIIDKPDFSQMIKKFEADQALKEIIGFELCTKGFMRTENVFHKNNFIVNLDRKFVHCLKNEAFLKIGKKGICSYSLEKLFSFEKIENLYEGKKFIKAIKECGITLTGEELFLLVEKMNTKRFDFAKI